MPITGAAAKQRAASRPGVVEAGDHVGVRRRAPCAISASNPGTEKASS